MYYFCTYFDRHYLPRGLALHRSLTRHAQPFVLFVLCFDDFTYDFLSRLGLPTLRPIALDQFERGDTALLEVKKTRNTLEYYYTCTPSLPLYILHHFPEVDLVTYLDADLFFFSNPAPIYQELGEQSVLIVEHRSPERDVEERFGKYNVSLVAFRRDTHAEECLSWWRERCLEWCYDRAEGGRFADQKYLDEWPRRFKGVAVLQHKGAGLAPWNVIRYRLRDSNGSMLVDSDPLIFYHFSQVKCIRPFLFDIDLDKFHVRLTATLWRKVYAPYLRELQVLARQTRLDLTANLRQGGTRTWGQLIRLVLYGRTISVIGPFSCNVHLEPVARPFLRLREFVLRSRAQRTARLDRDPGVPNHDRT